MRKLFLLVCTTIIFTTAFAQPKADQAYNLSGKQLAIEGYDPVSYFTKHRAVKGQSSIVATHNGVNYQFESQANKTAFLASPAGYEPQYGGWCAYAMGATGEKVEVDPETFKIVDGRLYLFYNKFFNNTLKSWNKDEIALMKKADLNWAKLYSAKVK